MNNNDKGFTLIELLAVIVILAIIALIASPIIIGLIDNARKEAFKNSAYGIVKAGELLYSQDLLNEINEEVMFTYTNGVESSSVSGKELKYKGKKPETGQVQVSIEGQVAIAIHNGNYCVEKGYSDSKVTLSEKAVGECVIPVPADNSGASVPELATGMIPIKWNGTNWIKADVNNNSGANSWYDYDAKEWANAVTVTSTNRATYLSAAVGTIIPMSDINTMWVWIPRYKYAIPTGAGPREINIVFEAKNTVKSTGNAIDTNYRTHPAFTFGTTEVNGIWVGKFETTGNLPTPTILPNTSSILSRTVKEMYDSSRTMENNAIYGTSTDVNIHMMKNSEWGALAYLSHSKYGKNSEIWINNSNDYTTGCAGSSVSASAYSGCQNQYHTATGVNASTTGNIYGIYDMSGGAWEYVMGMYRPTDATSITDTSGFGASTSNGTLPPSEYWDRYTTTNFTTACSSGICYGSALSETSGWYSDHADFVNSSYPWVVRGGLWSHTTVAGAFGYSGDTGALFNNYSFRLVQLKP